MKSITSPEVLLRVKDILANSNINEKDLTFIANAIMDTYLTEKELRDKLSFVNKMNEENYNKYCELLKEKERQQCQENILV